MRQLKYGSFLLGSLRLLLLPLGLHYSALHGQTEAFRDLPADQQGAVSHSATASRSVYPVFVPIELTSGKKAQFYFHRLASFSTVLGPASEAAAVMASPPKGYPNEWRQGASAYGLNVGAVLGRIQAAEFSRFVVGVVLHEDPRYYPSASRNISGRVTHAVGFTLVDRADAGHLRPAFANLIGATAGGFVGNAYLPANYTDLRHAGVRTGVQMGGFAAADLIEEFAPELRRLTQTLTSHFRHHE